jgi:predicted ATPase
MRETGRTIPWELKPNEPMLSRATDPSLRECSLVRNEILGWTFYADLCATRSAPLRQPKGLEGGTVLSETGDNLVAVLLALSTNQHFRDQWEELLSFLSAAIPEFETLTTTPDFSGKYVDLQWRERGVQGTLSAADLSDGILRLLILGAICCNPYPASLICIDEPEIGIHPRLLPLVGGLLQRASDRSQVIVLTHSPDLLYDMPLESIGVLRKRDGEAQIVWPRNHDLLYHILTEEIAGERQVDYDRLRLAHASGEMDELE